ncbi:MAG: peptidase M14, partial [Acidobacteria bacterium]|nr:peptidase M14 [Acidobacteriota bacterium]
MSRIGAGRAGSFVIAVAIVIGSFAASTGAQTAGKGAAPAPADVLGFIPGDDRKLADWQSISRYFERLAATSNRVRLETIGETTLGRPMLLATISSPANLARLDRIREVQRKLADPRSIESDAEARALQAEAVAVVLVTYGIHSTEVGSTLASTVMAYRLATDESASTREILDRAVVLIVPSLNPDGVDIVKKWYDASIGTDWEGEGPAELYQHFIGHDNNRDWYAFTQAETRAVVDRVHNVWRPHVVNDVHQMGSSGARLFVPPYLDPIEPNVPPELVAGGNMLGQSVAQHLTNAGLRGVVTDALFDAWTPARAYSHYHGGIRILTETASARIAS